MIFRKIGRLGVNFVTKRFLGRFISVLPGGMRIMFYSVFSVEVFNEYSIFKTNPNLSLEEIGILSRMLGKLIDGKDGFVMYFYVTVNNLSFLFSLPFKIAFYLVAFSCVFSVF